MITTADRKAMTEPVPLTPTLPRERMKWILELLHDVHAMSDVPERRWRWLIGETGLLMRAETVGVDRVDLPMVRGRVRGAATFETVAGITPTHAATPVSSPKCDRKIHAPDGEAAVDASTGRGRNSRVRRSDGRDEVVNGHASPDGVPLHGGAGAPGGAWPGVTGHADEHVRDPVVVKEIKAVHSAVESDLRFVHDRPHTWARPMMKGVPGAAVRLEPLLVSYLPLARSKDRTVGGVIWLRRQGGRPFSETDRLTLHLLHSSLQQLHNSWMRNCNTSDPTTGDPTTMSGPASVVTGASNQVQGEAQVGSRVLNLTPRQRQALRCLLEGQSEQSAARVMGVTRNTFHVHVKAIYREVGVRSRAELMSTLLQRDDCC